MVVSLPRLWLADDAGTVARCLKSSNARAHNLTMSILNDRRRLVIARDSCIVLAKIHIGGGYSCKTIELQAA